VNEQMENDDDADDDDDNIDDVFVLEMDFVENDEY
jgi:hypothetical protein